MANFKIVTNLDLSGNRLIDVTEISRENYDQASPNLDLAIRAGTNPVGGLDVAGGSLSLYSGSKNGGALANGSISLIHPDHSIVLSDNSLAITLINKPFNINTGAMASGGTINITSDLITVENDLWIKGNTTLGDGIGNDVTILGSDLMVAASIDLGQPANPQNIVFTVENETGNTTILGEFFQNTTGKGALDDVYDIQVDSSSVFRVTGEGTTYIQGALYVYSTPIIFSGATNFQVGSDDATQRDAVIHSDTVIGSVTNDKTLKIYGDTTFSNITVNDFTTLDTDKSTVNLFDTTPTTINAFGAATIIDIGSGTGITTVRNNFQVIGETDYLKFDSTYNDGALPEGALFYSSDDKALSYKTDVASTTINIGQENVFRARNVSGVTISNGDVVYISGAELSGNTPQITKSQGNTSTTSAVAGIATSEILNNGYGYVTVEGVVRGIDTSLFTAGDILYLSYSTAGKFTNIAPSIANATAWDVKIGSVLDDNASGSIKVHIGPCWTTYSTFNNVKMETLKIRDRFTLSSTAQTIEGSVYWDDAIDQIKYYTVDTIRTIVDTDTSQSIINKTYNALSLTSDTVGFHIDGGTTSKSLTLTGNVTFDTDFDLNIGNLVVNADVLHSELTFPSGHLDFSQIDTTDPDQRSLAVQAGVVKVSSGLQTDDAGNLFITGYIKVEGDYKTGSATYNFLPDIATTTLNLAQLTPNINIGNLGAVANTIQIGNSLATSVINLNSTKNSTAYTNGGVVVDGGIGVAGNIYTNGKLYLQNNSITNTLNLGGDVDLYRSLANELTIADNVILKDLQSSNATFNFATATTTTLNMLALTNTILNIGTTGSNTRQMNIFSAMTVGELANQKDIDLYGSLNIGGPTGYGIQYDPVDDSINFVKLV